MHLHIKSIPYNLKKILICNLYYINIILFFFQIRTLIFINNSLI